MKVILFLTSLFFLFSTVLGGKECKESCKNGVEWCYRTPNENRFGFFYREVCRADDYSPGRPDRWDKNPCVECGLVLFLLLFLFSLYIIYMASLRARSGAPGITCFRASVPFFLPEKAQPFCFPLFNSTNLC